MAAVVVDTTVEEEGEIVAAEVGEEACTATCVTHPATQGQSHPGWCQSRQSAGVKAGHVEEKGL